MHARSQITRLSDDLSIIDSGWGNQFDEKMAMNCNEILEYL